MNLGARASRAAGWSFVGFGASQALRLGGNLVLTRLLYAEAFGLLAIAGVLLQGLALFSDFGLGPSIIQNERGDDRDFLDTAWTIQAVRGVCLALLAAAGAWPFARFYDEPALLSIIPAIAITAFLQGLNSTKIFTVGRQLDLARLTALEVATQAIGVAVMIAWALASPTYWALVAGGITTATVKMVLSHLVLRGPIDRPRWHAPSAQALFHFGKWIFLSTALAFFASQSDRLIFGKLVPMAMLGVYSIGAMLALMPQLAFYQVEQRVVFPAYSRVHLAGEGLARVFPRVRSAFLAAGGWVVAGLVAGGPTLVALLYDARYHEAGWMVQVLSLGTWLGLLQSTNGAALLALGQARWVAVGSFCKIVGIVTLVPLGHRLGGFPGAVAGFACSEAFRYGVLTAAARRRGLRDLGRDAGLSALVAASAWVGLAVAGRLGDAGQPLVVQAAGIFVAVSLLWLPVGGPHLAGLPARLRGS